MLSKFRGVTVASLAALTATFGVTGVALAAKHHSKRHAANSTASTSRGAGNPAEAELTGDTATSAKTAALAAVPGGTVWRASTEDSSDTSGAAYEVHVTKSDGSEVEVLLKSDFSVLSTNASRQHRGGPDGHGGPGGHGSNEDPAHESGESAAREAQEGTSSTAPSTAPSTSSSSTGS